MGYRMKVEDWDHWVDLDVGELERLKSGDWIMRVTWERPDVHSSMELDKGAYVQLVRVAFKLKFYSNGLHQLILVDGDMEKYLAIRALNAGAERLPRIV